MHSEDNAGRTLLEEMRHAGSVILKVEQQLERWAADWSCCPPVAAEWAADDLGVQVLDVLNRVRENDDLQDDRYLADLEGVIEYAKGLRRECCSIAAWAPGLSVEERGNLYDDDLAVIEFLRELDAWRREHA